MLSMFLLLSSQLDEKSSGEYLFVEGVPDEVDGVDFGLEDDFERPRIVFFDFDEMKIREGFFNILLDGCEVAFDEVERDIFDLVIKALDALDKLLFAGNHKLLFLLLSLHHTNNIYYYQTIKII